MAVQWVKDCVPCTLRDPKIGPSAFQSVRLSLEQGQNEEIMRN